MSKGKKDKRVFRSMESLSFALKDSIRFLDGDVIKSLLYCKINFNINIDFNKSLNFWYNKNCKNINNNWYTYNDTDVSKLKNTNLLSKDAYMLFYYRKYIKTK